MSIIGKRPRNTRSRTLVYEKLNFYIVMDCFSVSHVAQPGLIGVHKVIAFIIIYDGLSIVDPAPISPTEVEVASPAKLMRRRILHFHDSYRVLLSEDSLKSVLEEIVIRVQMMSNKAVWVISKILVDDSTYDWIAHILYLEHIFLDRLFD